MNAIDLETFNQAVGLAQSGNKESAYNQLKALEQTNYKEVDLLLWLTFTAPTLREAETYVEKIAVVDPINPNLTTAKQWIAERKTKLNLTPKLTSKTNILFFWGIAIIIVLLVLLFLQTPMGIPIRDWIIGFLKGSSKS